MITRVTIENFKRFEKEEIELDETVVLAGPNNSGKTTLLQALACWSLALDKWRLGKGRSTTAKERTGQALTRKDFTALPLREFDLLWNERVTGLKKAQLAEGQKPGEPRLLHIRVNGTSRLGRENPWSLTMELRYQSPEQIYVKPVDLEGGDVPREALDLSIVHCPPFSGIGAEEKRMDRGAQNLEIGRAKPGDVLRNLLLEVSGNADLWEQLVGDVAAMFRVALQRPEYDENVMPYIVCEYGSASPGSRRGQNQATLDIASGGSGFLQVLLLLSFFYARPASVLLLDEPDAHLHVVLQRQVYDRLREVARRRDCQLIIATHSEVIIDGTPPTRITSFFGEHPHRLVRADQRDQVREAMKRLTAQDLLLAEQGRAVLYCEGESDFKILAAWARVLSHPAAAFFAEPFFHVNEGRNPREARGHLFALKAVQPATRGLLLLDGDNRGLPDHEIEADGLEIVRWRRYEIENYLVVPDAIERFLTGETGDLFSSSAADKAMAFLKTQVPPQTLSSPLADNATILALPASKDLLPQVFEAAGRPLEKDEFFLLADVMRPEEIHPEIVRVLDRIASLRISPGT